jgi:hypothetical protein
VKHVDTRPNVRERQRPRGWPALLALVHLIPGGCVLLAHIYKHPGQGVALYAGYPNLASSRGYGVIILFVFIWVSWPYLIAWSLAARRPRPTPLLVAGYALVVLLSTAAVMAAQQGLVGDPGNAPPMFVIDACEAAVLFLAVICIFPGAPSGNSESSNYDIERTRDP